MKNIVASLLLGFGLAASAANPDIYIKSNLYETIGPNNSLTIALGAAVGHSGYVDVISDNGSQTEAEVDVAYFDYEAGAMAGTYISCQVGPEGWIKINCDEGVLIDYLSITGAEITSIEFAHPEAMEILALEHNALESLDLTEMTNLTMLSLNDNPFNKSPLIVGDYKPRLQILEIAQIDNLDPDFDILGYPYLASFDAMSTFGLTRLTTKNCPFLQKISIDNTSVSRLDLSNNKDLYILNISDTRITEIDLSPCTKLQQFYAQHESWHNSDIKLKSLDVSSCPDLIYLFANGNAIDNIDLSNNLYLRDLYLRKNNLHSLDISANEELVNVFITGNYMDFNTLPLIQDYWLDYDFTQKPLSVPRSYLVGSQIDVASQVVLNRTDIDMATAPQTYATLYAINSNDPDDIREVSTRYYDFADGILTINQVLPDSVFASFYNPLFGDCELRTSVFKIKDADSYGKPELMASIGNILSAGADVSLWIGMDGAKADAPKKFYVDFGDGVQVEFAATQWDTPAEPNVVGKKAGSGDIKVYVPDSEVLTALKIDGMYLTSLDLSKLTELRELTLIGTELYSLDLLRNRALRSLVLEGNHFGSSFTLEGYNGGFSKNVLSRIVLSNNEMTQVGLLEEPYAIKYLDLSNNALSDLSFKNYDNIEYLDVSGNQLEELIINYCASLTTCYASDNKISYFVLPEENNIETLDISANNFTLANLPEPWASLSDYTYAPQAVIEIAPKGQGCDLSAQNVTYAGEPTVFTWKEENGTALTAGTDYECNGGVTRFKDAMIGKKVYCEIANAGLPQLAGDKALRTSVIEAAEAPQNLIASFVTPKVPNARTASIKVMSKQPYDAIYVDWGGDGVLAQYSMPEAGAFYTFESEVTADANVKIWSYEEDAQIAFFVLQNVVFERGDFSGLKHLEGLRFLSNYVSASAIVAWPETSQIRELSLDNNDFSKIDLSKFPELTSFAATGNMLKEIDLSKAPKLLDAWLANNRLEKVVLDNPQLYSLALSNNKLSEIDLTKVPQMYQLFLNENRFEALDLDALYSLPDLHVLYVDNNKLDFTTLPVPQPNWTFYLYGNQPTLQVEPQNGVVDLSSQLQRDGVQTEYTWFYDYPDFDQETGALTGQVLSEGVDYVIKDGVTTFLKEFDKVCGVLINALFPQTYLQTNLFATTAGGVKSIIADEKEPVYYNLQGIRVSGSNLPAGIYIRNGQKVYIK